MRKVQRAQALWAFLMWHEECGWNMPYLFIIGEEFEERMETNGRKE